MIVSSFLFPININLLLQIKTAVSLVTENNLFILVMDCSSLIPQEVIKVEWKLKSYL